MSRLQNTGKNFFFSVIATFITALTSFISRTIFIKTIGATYLGANGLFTNILTLLSLTELGLGSAIGFSLYLPLAKKDTETIKSLMHLYKKAYRIIALVILLIGLSLVPFLDLLIKDPGSMKHIPLIYMVFLYNTVVSYLFSYKTTLLVADQKSYLMTNATLIINLITVALQVVVLIVWKNYFVYLFVGAVINTAQWFVISHYINKLYPYLKDKNVQSLQKQEQKTISTNVRAMVFHKVGELCINQTDNIVISSFISIAAVGIYNNYFMIINIITKFAQSFFNSATASLGNLIATESSQRRYEVFKRYNFLGFWVYGWTGLCLTVLLNPFVELWIGKEWLIDRFTLALVMLNYYLVGMRTTVGNVKMAAGLYAQDQWAPIIQSIINLSVSIVGAIHLGLAGVFLGTVVSSLAVPCWYRPVIVYKYAFQQPVGQYFKQYLMYFAVVLANLLLVLLINNGLGFLIGSNLIVSFLVKAFICVIVPNIIIVALFHKTEEFRYLMGLLQKVKSRFCR